MKTSMFKESLLEAILVYQGLEKHEPTLRQAAIFAADALTSGHKLLICGNGGSASEAQHLTGELVGRFRTNRRPMAAISLASDATVLTCIGNDFDYDDVFARQVQALASPEDVLVAFSTSGRSASVLRALEAAKQIGARSIAFLGCDGGNAKNLADCAIVVRHQDTARIQEGHQFLMHALMDYLENSLTESYSS